MQFALESVSGQGVRLGKLLFNGGALDTPLCLLYTRSGVVPHLADDVLRDVEARPRAAMITLPTLYEMPGTEVLTQYKHGIHRFLNMQDHFLYLSVQDPYLPPPPGYNEEKIVSVWTNSGRKKVPVSDYLKLVESFRPTAFECLCDSVSSIGNRPKRIRKSVDRTIKFLEETLAARTYSKELQCCGLLGAVVGSDLVEERKRSASETAMRPVDGFVLEGFDLEHNKESQCAVIHSATQLLPADKPRFIHGLYTAGEIFTAVECGIDVFDGVYPYTATENGRALTFPNSPLQEPPDECNGTDIQPFEIDLKEDRYSSDFSPVLRGCPCYTCQYHTRAYVHHLLATKEILARVLLMAHNLSHYLEFFNNLRHSVKISRYIQFKQAFLCTQQ